MGGGIARRRGGSDGVDPLRVLVIGECNKVVAIKRKAGVEPCHANGGGSFLHEDPSFTGFEVCDDLGHVLPHGHLTVRINVVEHNGRRLGGGGGTSLFHGSVVAGSHGHRYGRRRLPGRRCVAVRVDVTSLLLLHHGGGVGRCC